MAKRSQLGQPWDSKESMLGYFRQRSREFEAEISTEFGLDQIQQKAGAINKKLILAKGLIVNNLQQNATKGQWTPGKLLDKILLVNYCSYVVMLESRNAQWPYEYMSFSRRIGELWEPFCRLTFEYPVKKVELFIPPLFSDVKKNLYSEIKLYIDQLSVTSQQRKELLKYYDKVWHLVTSGEIKLELDLHFIHAKQKCVVDFKSGFGSNEKGNTNRLLMVATIYKNIDKSYRPIIFVRSADNNHYFKTLQKSGVWEAYESKYAYKKMSEFSGFDLAGWIQRNVRWQMDFDSAMLSHLKKNKLLQYLTW